MVKKTIGNAYMGTTFPNLQMEETPNIPAFYIQFMFQKKNTTDNRFILSKKNIIICC
jgi:hypothetical protein